MSHTIHTTIAYARTSNQLQHHNHQCGGGGDLLHATDRKNNYNQVNSNDNLDLFNI